MKVIYVLAFLFAAFHTSAQGPVKDLGNVKSFKAGDQAVTFTTDNGYANIIVYSPSIFRVRADKQKLKKIFLMLWLQNRLKPIYR